MEGETIPFKPGQVVIHKTYGPELIHELHELKLADRRVLRFRGDPIARWLGTFMELQRFDNIREPLTQEDIERILEILQDGTEIESFNAQNINPDDDRKLSDNLLLEGLQALKEDIFQVARIVRILCLRVAGKTSNSPRDFCEAALARVIVMHLAETIAAARMNEKEIGLQIAATAMKSISVEKQPPLSLAKATGATTRKQATEVLGQLVSNDISPDERNKVEAIINRKIEEALERELEAIIKEIGNAIFTSTELPRPAVFSAGFKRAIVAHEGYALRSFTSTRLYFSNGDSDKIIADIYSRCRSGLNRLTGAVPAT